MKKLLIIIFLFALVDGLYSFYRDGLQVQEVINSDVILIKLLKLRDSGFYRWDNWENGKHQYGHGTYGNGNWVAMWITNKLYGIDCPEYDQPFGKEAERFTKDFVLN